MQVSHDQHLKANEKKTYPLRLLLLDIELPENVGGIFRIADALGVEHLYLVGNTLAPPNNKLKKVARSTDKYVPYSCEPNALLLIKDLKEKGWRVLSLEYCESSNALSDINHDHTQPCCVVLGSEKYGVPENVLNESDACVRIPMRGENSSMNVANAAAICVYTLSQLFEN